MTRYCLLFWLTSFLMSTLSSSSDSPSFVPAKCKPLPATSFCGSILSYTVDEKICVSTKELLLESRHLTLLSTECQRAVAVHYCFVTFKPCPSTNSSSITFPHTSVCQTIQSSCSSASDRFILANISRTSVDSFACSSQSSLSFSASDLLQSSMQLLPARCEIYSGSICSSFINYPVFIPAGRTQQQLEQMLESLPKLSMWQSVASGCQKALHLFMCSRVFMRCDEKSAAQQLGLLTPYSIPTPSMPSIQLCLFVKQMCPYVFSMLKLTCGETTDVTNCDGTVLARLDAYASIFIPKPSGEITAYNTWPGLAGVTGFVVPSIPLTFVANSSASSFFMNKPLSILSSPSFSSSLSNTSFYSDFFGHLATHPAPLQLYSCEYPLVYLSDEELTTQCQDFKCRIPGNCQVACLSPIMTPEQWDVAYIIAFVCSFICFVPSVLVSIIWYLDSRDLKRVSRKANTPLHAYFICSSLWSFILMLSYLITLKDRKPNSPLASSLNCETAMIPHSLQRGVSLCAIQAFFFYVIIIAQGFYTFFYCLDFLILILSDRFSRHHSSSYKTKKMLIYHSIAVGVGLIFGFVLFAEESFGGAGLPYCTAMQTTPTTKAWRYVQDCLTGGTCLVLTSVIILLLRSENKQQASRPKAQHSRPSIRIGNKSSSATLPQRLSSDSGDSQPLSFGKTSDYSTNPCFRFSSLLQYKRMIIFIIVQIIFSAVVLSYDYISDENMPRWLEEGVTWFLCWLSTSNTKVNEACSFPDFSLEHLFVILLISLLGPLVPFFLFVKASDIFKICPRVCCCSSNGVVFVQETRASLGSAQELQSQQAPRKQSQTPSKVKLPAFKSTPSSLPGQAVVKRYSTWMIQEEPNNSMEPQTVPFSPVSNLPTILTSPPSPNNEKDTDEYSLDEEGIS